MLESLIDFLNEKDANMKWKQVLIVVGILGASGNLMAQDAKTPATHKPGKKQGLVVVNKQTGITGKTIVRKSLNPDRPDFIGVPLVMDSK